MITGYISLRSPLSLILRWEITTAAVVLYSVFIYCSCASLCTHGIEYGLLYKAFYYQYLLIFLVLSGQCDLDPILAKRGTVCTTPEPPTGEN